MNEIQLVTDASQPSVSCHSGKGGGGSFMSGRSGMVLIAMAVLAGLALALDQHWLLAAQLVPLLFLLPCMAMMFMCLKGHGGHRSAQPVPLKIDTANADTPQS
ncbi:DUF2933 domain-containing protein [uncultured Bradyrhizobium sp.]|uniref:DUF2933 domain-containing protein n=1 Tax=uncultured Bradyrhizobium sp. TaxID=199684 RepID=UPI002639DE9F|nr:DUF2933 domain-containing protein [uncultured Bradyrhizobium sp.]